MGLSENMPILPLLEHYGFDDVKPDCGWHTVRCVFHGDRKASGRVSTRENAYRCQACDAKGDTISLIMWRERIPDVASAIGFYESVTRIRVERISGKTPGSRGGGRPRIPDGGKAAFERGGGLFPSRLHRGNTSPRRPRSPN